MKQFFCKFFEYVFNLIILLVLSVVIVPPLIALNASTWLIAIMIVSYPYLSKHLPTTFTIADIVLWIVGLIWVILKKTDLPGTIGKVFPIVYYVLFAVMALYLISGVLSGRKHQRFYKML